MNDRLTEWTDNRQTKQINERKTDWTNNQLIDRCLERIERTNDRTNKWDHLCVWLYIYIYITHDRNDRWMIMNDRTDDSTKLRLMIKRII